MNVQIFKLDIEKAEEPEIKLSTSIDHRKSKRVPEEHLLLLYWLCQSLWLCGSQQTVENSSRDGNTRPPDLPPQKSVCRSRTTVRSEHGTTDLLQIGKWVCQGYVLSFYLFNLYAEYIIWDSELDEVQARIKIARRNVNNLRYADDTTLMQKVKNYRASWWKWKWRVKKLI